MTGILKASLVDAGQLECLINAAYRGDSSRKGWTTEADLLNGTRTTVNDLQKIIDEPGSHLFKYVANDSIKACMLLEEHDVYLYLGMLTVSPELQGKGIGKILLTAAESEAKKMGCNIIRMTVISVRHELIGWYNRHGYALTGDTKPFPAGDERFGIPKMPLEFVVLEKRLH